MSILRTRLNSVKTTTTLQKILAPTFKKLRCSDYLLLNLSQIWKLIVTKISKNSKNNSWSRSLKLQTIWGLLTLIELWFKKKVSNSLLKRTSASPDNGLSRCKMSTEEKSSRCRSNTSRSATQFQNLIATTKQGGKEKSAKSSRRNFKHLGTDPRESLVTHLATLLRRSRRS